MLKIEDFFHSLIPYVKIIFTFHSVETKSTYSFIGEVPSKTIGDIRMTLVLVPPAIATLFLGDHFFLLRKLLLLVGTTGFLRPITFCVTHLPDSCSDSRPNQYPFFFFIFCLSSIILYIEWCSS